MLPQGCRETNHRLALILFHYYSCKMNSLVLDVLDGMCHQEPLLQT